MSGAGYGMRDPRFGSRVWVRAVPEAGAPRCSRTASERRMEWAAPMPHAKDARDAKIQGGQVVVVLGPSGFVRLCQTKKFCGSRSGHLFRYDRVLRRNPPKSDHRNKKYESRSQTILAYVCVPYGPAGEHSTLNIRLPTFNWCRLSADIRRYPG